MCVELSDDNVTQLFFPGGFAHGFCVLSDVAEILYKCSEFYDPKDDRGFLWNEPAFGVEWPVTKPILSQKDTIQFPFDKRTEADFPHVEL